MRYDEGAAVLRRMLSEAGLGGSKVAFVDAWKVFKTFAAIPISEELPTRDLFTYTSSSETNPPSSYVCVLRSMSRAYRLDRGPDEWGDKVETVEELFFSFEFPYADWWPEEEIGSDQFPTLQAFFTALERRGGFYSACRMETGAMSVEQRKLY